MSETSFLPPDVSSARFPSPVMSPRVSRRCGTLAGRMEVTVGAVTERWLGENETGKPVALKLISHELVVSGDSWIIHGWRWANSGISVEGIVTLKCTGVEAINSLN